MTKQKSKAAQVLCPMARGGCGSRSLNIELQQLLNPDPVEQVERFGWRFAPGDKVMQIANDYDKEVFNGDVGTIDAIDADNSALGVLFPTSEAGVQGSRVVVYGWGELDHLVPAYACTIHKSQGSEYPAVVIPLLTHHLGRRRYTKLGEWLAPADATTAPLAIRVSPSSQAIHHAHRN